MKKIVIYIYLFVFLSNSTLNIELAFASLSITKIKLGLDNIQSDIYKNPGDVFSIFAEGKNYGDTLNNLEAEFLFNTTNLEYSEPGTTDSYVNGTVINTDIGIDNFNPPFDNTAKIADQVKSSLIFDLFYTKIKIPENSNDNVISVGLKFNADGYSSVTTTRNVFINIKPHIVDYYFTKPIVNNGIDSTDLIVKVKDYNGCSNIDGGTITANLSQLGLSSNENLIYTSCDTDGKTATFKKIGITYLGDFTGDKTFTYTDFKAIDENGNINNPNDTNTVFINNVDKIDSIVLTINPISAPIISGLTATPNVVGSSVSNSIVSFSADKGGEYKVVIDGNGTCTEGSVISDRTGYATGSITNINISKDSLIDGNNSIFVCVKNTTGDIGSSNVNIIKDIITPTLYNIVAIPSYVTTQDSKLEFFCNEDGQYKVTINSYDSGYQGNVRDVKNSFTINNSYITNIGDNTVTLYCKDFAGNESFTTTKITKELPVPAMTNSGITLSDNDIGWDGVDGRDLKVTWDTTIGSNFSGFSDYVIYLLPENTAFTGRYIGFVGDKNQNTWTGSRDILNDSLGNPIAGGNYTTYVAIIGKSGEIGIPGSGTGNLVSDIVPHPSVISSSFTSLDNLEVRFDTNLKTDTGSQFATGFTYQVGSNTYTGISINSVNENIINVKIDSLPTTYSTGILYLNTGAVWGTPVDGSYNFATGGINIIDNIKPNINSFTLNTSSAYSNFYSGIINLSYDASEDLKANGYTYIKFNPVGGNIAQNRSYPITLPTKLTSGPQNIDIDLSTLGLVSGTEYEVTFEASDINLNKNSSIPINIKFDNNGPDIVTIEKLGPNSVLGVASPVVSWVSVSDNYSNGSGVKGYKIRIYDGDNIYTNWKTCTGTYNEFDHTDLGVLSKQVNLANLQNFARTIYAYDNMGNIGSTSTCDNFYINTNVPSFSGLSITDTILNSTSYTKGGNNLVIKANITNTNSGNIWLNATNLKDDSYLEISCANPVSGVTCSYIGELATYTFSAGASAGLSSGVKQVLFKASNTSGINTGTLNTSITLDNEVPNVDSQTILTPISGMYGGTGITVNWNQTKISDNIGIKNIKLEYFNGTSRNEFYSGPNSGEYIWDINSLNSGNYKTRLSAFDTVDHITSVEGGDFIIDKIAPSTPNLSYPSNTGIKLRGGQNINITWDTSITDNYSLATNPITIYYSLNSGSNYTKIAGDLENNGTYNWKVPEQINTTTAKIKIEVKDNVGNKSEDISNNNFEIDSISPILDITFAGNGGTTPQSNKYINNSGIEITGNTEDLNLDGGKLFYSFKRSEDSKYWDGTNYIDTENWNEITTFSSGSYNIVKDINPNVENLKTYKLKIRATDYVGNTKDIPEITYFGDDNSPSLVFTNSSGSYFNGNINISGNSVDHESGLSSTNLEIKKGSSWWDGNSWTGSQIILTTNGDASSWNYEFIPPLGDSDGQMYEITGHSYDKTYKDNNSTNEIITIIQDKTGPNIESDIWQINTTGIKKGGDNYAISWDENKITSTGASISHIKLKYNSGTGIFDIADYQDNDGDYDFVLPTIDTTCMRLIIEAKDTIGNNSNEIASDCIKVDSLPPSINIIQTLDKDTDGKVDGVIIKFSELINHSLNYSDFSVSDGINTSSYSINDIGSNSFVELNFDGNYFNSSYTPNITYSGTSVKDLAGNELVGFSDYLSEDKVNPRLVKAEAYDDDSNGKLDHIKITFSENLSPTNDILSFVLNNPLSGMNIISSSVSDNYGNLVLSESDNYNTSSSGITISFLNNGNWTDLIGNESGNPGSDLELGDKAKPIVILSETSGNRQVDNVIMQFSENLIGSTSGFSLNGFIAGAYTGILNLNNDTIEFTIDNSLVNTSQTGTINYSGVLADNNGNNVGELLDIFIQDKVEPKILTSETQDSNSNGKIDSLIIHASEALGNDLIGFIASASGYSVLSNNTQGNDIIINLTEKNIDDTNVTPIIKITSNTSLTDLGGNLITDFTNKTPQDKVGPVISSARYIQDKIYLSTSELILGTLTAGDFVLSGTTANIIGVSQNGKEFVLGLNEQLGNGAYITLNSLTVSDIFSNKQASNKFIIITSSIIINEVMYSTGFNQYIELRNLGSNIVNISNWKIENGLGETLDLIIPGGTSIGSGELFLIAKNSMTFSGGIVPDLSVDLDLGNITSNLVLKDSSDIVWDEMQTNPYPAGNANNGISAERKNTIGIGTDSINWYNAVTNNGLNTGLYGTPKNSNVFDSENPILTSQYIDNMLFPTGNTKIIFNYSDNIGVDLGSVIFNLKTGDLTDITGTGVNTSEVLINKSSYTTNNLPYGKYIAEFSIQDTTGNISTKTFVFYIDNFTMEVTPNISTLGNILPDNTLRYSDEVTVTIKTLGAGFNLKLGGDSTMSGPGGGIGSYLAGEGYGFDIYKNENTQITDYNNNIEAITNSEIGNNTLDNNSLDGNLKTFTYKIKHGIIINPLQAAGNYSAISNFGVNLDY